MSSLVVEASNLSQAHKCTQTSFMSLRDKQIIIITQSQILILTTFPTHPTNTPLRNISTSPHRPNLYTSIELRPQINPLHRNIIARIHITATNRRSPIPFPRSLIPCEIHKCNIRNLHFRSAGVGAVVS